MSRSFEIGDTVTRNFYAPQDPGKPFDDRKGRVTGFDRNRFGSPVLAVEWEDGEVSTIHPNFVFKPEAPQDA